MASTRHCLQGHSWEAAADDARCPQCGGAAVKLTAETIPYQPATSPPVDLNAPTLGADEIPYVLPAEYRPRIGDYQVLDEIGRGGMGVVYKAEQLSLKRPVALKMILAGSHAGRDHLTRFRNEAEAVARLQHPNIVQIYQISEHEGKPYLALEYVDGGTLAGRLSAVGYRQSAKPQETAGLVECLARAVHHAHKRNIIHRDLKPGNVLLMADGTPKITDFGLAKQLQGDTPTTASGAATVTGAIMGTPSYMAPEQADGKKRVIGPAVDVYALGAILYELLTGQPPFKGDSPMSTAIKVVTEEPIPPHRLQPRVPRDLETICLKCLEKDPAKRYETAEALADDLRRFQQGEPISARRQGVIGRTARWVLKRWKAAAFVVAGFFLAFVLLIILGILTSDGTLDPEGNQEQPPGPGADDVNDRELQRFQGDWAVMAVEENGRAAPAALLADALITCTGSQFRYRVLDKTGTAMIQLNARVQPHEMDFLAAGIEGGKPGFMTGTGIYQWNAPDTAIICFTPEGQPRPSDLNAKPGSGTVSITIRRVRSPVAQGDAERLLGTWELMSGVLNGTPLPEEQRRVGRLELTKDSLIFRAGNQMNVAKYEIDATRLPRTIDLYTNEASAAGIVPGAGIYELDGDTLRLCLAERGKPRPTEFASPPGSNFMLMVLKRAGTAPVESATVPLPADLNLVPRDAVGFVSLRVADFLAGDAAKRLQDSLGKSLPALDELLKNWQGLVTNILTIPPSDVERATLVVLDEQDIVLILMTKQPYDRDKLLKRTDARVEPLQPDPRRYYMITSIPMRKQGDPQPWQYSVYLMHENVLLIGLSGRGAAAPTPAGEPGKEPGKRPPRPAQQVGRMRGHVVEVLKDSRIVIATPEGASVKEGHGVLVFRPDAKGDPLSRRLGVFEIVEVKKDQVTARPVLGQAPSDRVQVNDVALFVPRPASAPPTERHTSIEDLIWQLPSARSDGPLQLALQQAAGMHHLVLGFNPPEQARKELDQLLSTDIASARPLLQATSLVGTLDLHSLSLRNEANLQLAFRFQFADAARAADGFAAAQATQVVLQSSLSRWIQQLSAGMGRSDGAWAVGIPIILHLFDELNVALRAPNAVERHEREVRINLSLRLDFAQIAKLQAEAAEKVRVAADRARSQNNLKQMALAFEEYERAHGSYPPVFSTDAQGKSLLSWRVLLLPYYREPSLTQLHKRFKLDEPWDSPHNRGLLPEMPGVYLNPRVPSEKGATGTHYQRLVGNGAGAESSVGPGLRRADFTDGLAATIMLVEAEQVVPWTKPEDVHYDPKRALPKLGGIVPTGFNLVFFDGRVKHLPPDFDQPTLRALITRAGGERVDVKKLP
jgi:uncharacterized protein (TIGR03067 family)